MKIYVLLVKGCFINAYATRELAVAAGPDGWAGEPGVWAVSEAEVIGAADAGDTGLRPDDPPPD